VIIGDFFWISFSFFSKDFVIKYYSQNGKNLPQKIIGE
jgi:hypothetical protein